MANSADPVCWMYSLSPSPSPSFIWIGMKCVPRVPDVGEEEQSGVQPAQTVAPVHEVVAAAQHLGAAVMVRMHHPYVRIGGDQRLTVAALDVEIRLAELAAARHRCPLGLCPADDPLLLTQRLPVPDLDRHVDPAATRYEPPASHCPFPSAPAGTHTCSSMAAGSSALRFIVPSLNPIRFLAVS